MREEGDDLWRDEGEFCDTVFGAHFQECPGVVASHDDLWMPRSKRGNVCRWCSGGVEHGQRNQTFEEIWAWKLLECKGVLRDKIVVRQFGEFGKASGAGGEEQACDCSTGCDFRVEAAPIRFAMGEKTAPGGVTLDDKFRGFVQGLDWW